MIKIAYEIINLANIFSVLETTEIYYYLDKWFYYQ